MRYDKIKWLIDHHYTPIINNEQFAIFQIPINDSDDFIEIQIYKDYMSVDTEIFCKSLEKPQDEGLKDSMSI